jgi:hypothetical protein
MSAKRVRICVRVRLHSRGRSCWAAESVSECAEIGNERAVPQPLRSSRPLPGKIGVASRSLARLLGSCEGRTGCFAANGGRRTADVASHAAAAMVGLRRPWTKDARTAIIAE